MEPPAADREPPIAAEPRGEPAAQPLAAEAGQRGARSDDEEGARLVALDMALGGTPRAQTGGYLAEHYELGDADGLLDDVYELAGR